MAITEHPAMGAVLNCDFNTGFVPPEIVKQRPVVIISPKITGRPGLCTVVALSSTPPSPKLACHCQITLYDTWPGSDANMWVKGDMVYAVSFSRLNFVTIRKDDSGKRIYYNDGVGYDNLKRIRACVLSGIGLSQLTKHL